MRHALMTEPQQGYGYQDILDAAVAAKVLQDMGVEKVSHIEPGFGGWKNEMPVEDYETWKANRKS